MTPRPRPTGEPVPIYLPLALKELPCTQTRRAAAALILDTSPSMTELTASGKLKGAAAVFIDLLSFPKDQAAISEFDSSGRMVREPTRTRRRSGNSPVMVLLRDGRTPEHPVEAE